MVTTEGKPMPDHDQFQQQARRIVFEYVRYQFDKSDETYPFELNDVYVVWFAKVLANWKALVSTNLPDGKYYEVTHNGEDFVTYLDVYVKVTNVAIPDEM